MSLTKIDNNNNNNNKYISDCKTVKIILSWSVPKIILHVVTRAMDAEGDRKILAQFKDENGVLVKAPFDIPINITPDLLQSLCNALVEEVNYMTLGFSAESTVCPVSCIINTYGCMLTRPPIGCTLEQVLACCTILWAKSALLCTLGNTNVFKNLYLMQIPHHIVYHTQYK